MSDQEKTTGDEKQVIATGHVLGTMFEIKATLGKAVITIQFDGSEPLDDDGLGPIDLLMAALPEACEQVMAAISAARDAEEEGTDG